MNIYKNLLLLAVFLSPQVKANFTGPIDLNAEIECLALNIYHEARSERTAGMWAVADVTINRVKSISYPNTVCEVVYQGPVYESWKTARFDHLPDSERIYNPVKGMCQFSWYCDGKSDKPTEPDSWQRAKDIAYGVMNHDLGLGLTDGADHYHANFIEPFWAPHMTLVTTIGNHKFYKSIR